MLDFPFIGADPMRDGYINAPLDKSQVVVFLVRVSILFEAHEFFPSTSDSELNIPIARKSQRPS